MALFHLFNTMEKQEIKKEITNFFKQQITKQTISDVSNKTGLSIDQIEELVYKYANKYFLDNKGNDIEIWWNSCSNDLKACMKKVIDCEHEPNSEELNKIVKIEKLNCEHFDLKDITPLFRLTNLKSLNLRNTSVLNIEPLSKLDKLKKLDLTFCLVKTIKPIWDIQIDELYLKKTSKLAYEEIKQYIQEHPNCKVDWDYAETTHWEDHINN